MSICKADGCGEFAKVRGYCTSHYYSAIEKGEINTYKYGGDRPVCKVAGCDRPAKTKGMCHMHYSRFIRTGSVERKRKANLGNCKAPGCDRPAKVKGYCPKHYSRMHRNGDLELRKRGRNMEFTESLRNKHIVMMHNEGATFSELADMFSKSRQWAQQLYERDKDKYTG